MKIIDSFFVGDLEFIKVDKDDLGLFTLDVFTLDFFEFEKAFYKRTRKNGLKKITREEYEIMRRYSYDNR